MQFMGSTRQKAKACVGLTPSELILENALDRLTASEMNKSILYVFEKLNLVNKLVARRQMFSAA